MIDPLAGSNVTGAAAESLGRMWIGIERNTEYVRASQFRFEEGEATQPTKGQKVADKPALPLFNYADQNLINYCAEPLSTLSRTQVAVSRKRV